MGPRLFSRGNAVASGRLPTRGPSFNGAATLQPRKLRDRVDLLQLLWQLQWGRDSSAAEMQKLQIKKSQRWALQWGRDSSAAEIRSWLGRIASRLGASMGPRLFSRGNPAASTSWRCRPKKLQWGRDSSAAEMGLSWSGPLPFSSLQWGRDSSAAEITSNTGFMHPPRCFNGAAALQPRKCSCQAKFRCQATTASMGPRLFSRGNEYARESPWEKGSLQWGRDSSAAEISPALISRGASGHLLQWGRDSSAAEISSCSQALGAIAAGFNGAATLQPRKCDRHICFLLHTIMLQWGRDSSAAEITHPLP